MKTLKSPKVKVLQSSAASAKVAGGNYIVTLNYKALVAEVSMADGARKVSMFRLPLGGMVIKYGSDDKHQAEGTLAFQSAEMSQSAGQVVLALRLRGDGDLTESKTVTLTFRPECFMCRQEFVAKADLPIQEVRYAAAEGDIQKASGKFDELFVWDPDRYGTAIPKNHRLDLQLSSFDWTTYESIYKEGGFFKNDMGRYIYPPFVAALQVAGQWMGVATMEVPNAEVGLELPLTDSSFYVTYKTHGNIVARQGQPYVCPEVGFFFSQERDDIVRTYASTLFDLGRSKRATHWEKWWAGPIFCFFADQLYQFVADGKAMSYGEDAAAEYLNDKFFGECTKIMDNKNLPWPVVIFDYGWFEKMGDWEPTSTAMKDLKKTIAKLHRQGKKVVLWFASYFVDQESKVAKEHPEWMIQGLDGKPWTRNLSWLRKIAYMPDYTNPKMREYMAGRVKYMLGKDGLNADGLKFDCAHIGPKVSETRYFDPSWGIGERLQYGSMQVVYQAAKEAKPDCLIEASSGNPLFNDVQDLSRLNDASTHCSSIYEERAWVSWISGANVTDTDDWSAFKKYFVHLNLKKCIFGVPALYAVKWRGFGRHGGGPGGYPVRITEQEYRRASSIFKVYEHCPIDGSHELFLDPENKVFWRKHTKGTLAGFYAAIGLAGNQAIACYQEKSALVTAVNDASLVMPLPPKARSLKLAAVLRSGKKQPVKFSKHGDSIVFDAQSSAGNVSHYLVSYVV